MIQINQLKLPIKHDRSDIEHKILKLLGIKPDALEAFTLKRRSIDARDKENIFYVYSVLVKLKENAHIKKFRNSNIIYDVKPKKYHYTTTGHKKLPFRPVIAGLGPAGIFCAYGLAKRGFKPIIIEQGKPVGQRLNDVNHFWKTGELDAYSNVQFGEGGAGTFSDGKLNTLVKDSAGRGYEVLRTFVDFGAPEEILYDSKPHVGTDIIQAVIINIRTEIENLGGKVLFSSKLTDFSYENNNLTNITVKNLHDDKDTILQTNILVMAIGHSARDTFELMYDNGLILESKSFAVGVRVEHKREMINLSQYGSSFHESLPAASYKLTHKCKSGRGVYTFCMCPGGYVVNASSESGEVAVNGMSYHSRDGENSNSAVVAAVNREDFGSSHPLAGMEFQRELEKAAYKIGNGNIPIQRFGDFINNKSTNAFGKITPCIKGRYTAANIRPVFPEALLIDIEEGITAFGRKITGFDDPDTILSAVESRTSSPVRIIRSNEGVSNVSGIYPCGEGAGYAGGITSAAIDGLKVAELIAKKFYI